MSEKSLENGDYDEDRVKAIAAYFFKHKELWHNEDLESAEKVPFHFSQIDGCNDDFLCTVMVWQRSLRKFVTFIISKPLLRQKGLTLRELEFTYFNTVSTSPVEAMVYYFIKQKEIGQAVLDTV